MRVITTSQHTGNENMRKAAARIPTTVLWNPAAVPPLSKARTSNEQWCDEITAERVVRKSKAF